MDEKFINSTLRMGEAADDPDLEQNYEKDNGEEAIPLTNR